MHNYKPAKAMVKLTLLSLDDEMTRDEDEDEGVAAVDIILSFPAFILQVTTRARARARACRTQARTLSPSPNPEPSPNPSPSPYTDPKPNLLLQGLLLWLPLAMCPPLARALRDNPASVKKRLCGAKMGRVCDILLDRYILEVP